MLKLETTGTLAEGRLKITFTDHVDANKFASATLYRDRNGRLKWGDVQVGQPIAGEVVLSSKRELPSWISQAANFNDELAVAVRR